MAKHNPNKIRPIALFDNQEYLPKQKVMLANAPPFAAKEFEIVKAFLLQYKDNYDTYNAYRREAERLTQWAWLIKGSSLLELSSPDIEDYIAFCQSPPKKWIGIKTVTRFVMRSGERMPNPEWQLFVAKKQASTKTPDANSYQFSQKALQSLFIAISSFYNYLIREGISETNPIAQIRQKSKFIRKQQNQRQIRRLTSLQWNFVIDTAEKMANSNPSKYERTLFIMSALYLMYLRISELVTTKRWEPQMGHFYQDSQENWWFKTVGKGNKARDITVSQAMLNALIRYRRHQGLHPPLPLPGDTTPLISRHIGKGGITSTRQIRSIVQECFDLSIDNMRREGFSDEANTLAEATVHWLRHTGISDDLNKRNRPTIHVRDDAGHTSSATTDLYNDAETQARHNSGKNKQIID